LHQGRQQGRVRQSAPRAHVPEPRAADSADRSRDREGQQGGRLAMGMSSGSGDKKAVQSEINVTPLIDVLLVLLIIFLVVMPIMMKMETLEIPRKLEDNQTVDEKAMMLTVTLNPGGSVVFTEISAAIGEK